MKRILLAATAAIALAMSASMATAAEGKFVFRWKGTVATVANNGGSPVDPSTGEPGNGSGDNGGGEGSGDDSGSGGGGDDPDDGSAGAGPRMALSVHPADDAGTREHYRLNMPFGIPVIIASPTGTYGDGDVLTVCWDTEIYDGDGIAGEFRQHIELPPSPLVRAITVAGERVERDMDSFDLVTFDRAGGDGCADLELTVPEADSFGWGMGIPFGVTVTADVYGGWWAHDPVAWEDPDAYETTPSEAPGWLYLDATRIE